MLSLKQLSKKRLTRSIKKKPPNYNRRLGKKIKKLRIKFKYSLKGQQAWY